MNYRMLGYVLGRIFMVEAALLLPPSIVAVIYGEWSCLFAFVVFAIILFALTIITQLLSCILLIEVSFNFSNDILPPNLCCLYTNFTTFHFFIHPIVRIYGENST